MANSMQPSSAPCLHGVNHRPANTTALGDVASEPHLSVKEVSATWGMSPDTVQRIFRHEDGVLKLCRPATKYKRGHTTLYIPVSVMRRVHHRLHG